jgi:hypothetical protein
MSNFFLLRFPFCQNKYSIFSVLLLIACIYKYSDTIELEAVEIGVTRYIYGIKSLELNSNYTTKKSTQISEKELNNQSIKSSMFSFEDIFKGMENTLRSTNTTCIAMHHYKLSETPRQLAGMLINNRTDFIGFINPVIDAQSLKQEVFVRYRNNTVSRFQYVWIHFYHDLVYGREYESGDYMHHGNGFQIKKENQYGVFSVFERFYKSHVPKKRFVKVGMRLHNEYSICMQNIIEEF